MIEHCWLFTLGVHVHDDCVITILDLALKLSKDWFTKVMKTLTIYFFHLGTIYPFTGFVLDLVYKIPGVFKRP